MTYECQPGTYGNLALCSPRQSGVAVMIEWVWAADEPNDCWIFVLYLEPALLQETLLLFRAAHSPWPAHAYSCATVVAASQEHSAVPAPSIWTADWTN